MNRKKLREVLTRVYQTGYSDGREPDNDFRHQLESLKSAEAAIMALVPEVSRKLVSVGTIANDGNYSPIAAYESGEIW